MKILFQLGHPAHFHLFKNVIFSLKEKGHHISILIKRKDILEYLLDKHKLEYSNILPSGRKDSKLGIAIGQLRQDFGVLKHCIKSRPDIMIGTSIAILTTLLNPGIENTNTWYLALCGVVAICSMILPGISGSFVLLLMGNYKLLAIDAINTMDFQLLTPFAIGSLVGIIAFSHLLSWVYKRYRNQTIALLTGFILGSLAILWPWQTPQFLKSPEGEIIMKNGEAVIESYQRTLPALWNTEFFFAIIIILLGIFSVWLVELSGQVKKSG